MTRPGALASGDNLQAGLSGVPGSAGGSRKKVPMLGWVVRLSVVAVLARTFPVQRGPHQVPPEHLCGGQWVEGPQVSLRAQAFGATGRFEELHHKHVGLRCACLP